MQYFDVVIIGGGIVGLSLACGLQGNLQVVVLEQQKLQSSIANTFQNIRVSAINAASEKLLIRLGVWSHITESKPSCYRSMEIWDKHSFGHIKFDDINFGCSHLGYIVKNTVIHTSLWQKAQKCNNITLMAPVQLHKIIWGENKTFITLKNGDIIATQLVVGADGANSWLRNKAKIPLTFWDYRHHALVATVRTAESHDNIVRQVFHSDGILAFLPLSNPHLCSIVWSLMPEDAQLMSKVEPAVFNKAICVTFDNRLGLCSLVSDRYTLKLTGCYARQFAAHRLALIGDAAHTIHPLAGQGINLGFMDVAKLLEEIYYLHNEGKDIGQYAYLRRYERNRKYSAALMLASMQGLCELFTGNHPVKKLLRNIGLKFVDMFPSIKRQLILQAMGLKDIPDWLN